MIATSRLEKSLILALVGILVSGGMAWGRLTYQVAEQERRIEALEKRVQKISVVAGVMQFQLIYGIKK